MMGHKVCFYEKIWIIIQNYPLPHLIWSTEYLSLLQQTKRKQSEGLSTFHQLIGRELDDVQTLGKELFMYFGDLCLR